MTIKGLDEAMSLAADRIRRAKGAIDILYIIEVADNEYIVSSAAYLPQLSKEYERFKVVKTLRIKRANE